MAKLPTSMVVFTLVDGVWSMNEMAWKQKTIVSSFPLAVTSVVPKSNTPEPLYVPIKEGIETSINKDMLIIV